jgi:hypothetical protein
VQLVSLLSDVVTVCESPTTNEEIGHTVKGLLAVRGTPRQLQEEGEAVIAYNDDNYHRFAKWLFFGGEGVIADNDPEEQEKMIKYNDLVATAVIFQVVASFGVPV